MTNTTKTVIGVATAAAISTGVLLTTVDNETENNINSPEETPIVETFVDDIKPISVPIFSVETLALNIPTVETTKIELSNVETTKIELPNAETTKIEIPNVETLSLETIDIVTTVIETIGVENLSLEKIEIIVSVVESVKTENYSVETIYVATNIIDEIGIKNLSPLQIKVLVNTVDKLDGDVPKIQLFRKMLVSIIKDQRMLEYDSSLTIYNTALDAWLTIYNSSLPPPIKYIPLPRNIRMIAELRTIDFAEKNLAFYKSRGYNSCLISINGTETKSQILALVNAVRKLNMSVWIAWSGPESLEWSIFQEPKKIVSLLNAAAPFCQGYIPAWRRTSAHLVSQDDKYIEYLTDQVRKVNPKILVVGESYYGQTWQNLPYVNQKGWEARDNIVRNQSGILITGIATHGFAVESMLNTIFGKWRKTSKLAMVLGEKPYYASSNNTNKNFLENLVIKQQIETRFKKAGCFGTITIHGDGSDRGLDLQSTDDLGKFLIKR